MNTQHPIALHCHTLNHTPAACPTTHYATNLLPLPLQMMTAVQETGEGVSLSELVTGVTTSRCPLQMMTAVEKTGGGVFVSELVTGVTTSRCPLQMMTAVEKTGGDVSLSELVIGVTSQCCRWVSPHTSTHS